MQCPAKDGELIHHTAQGENNLTVSYSTCAACHGYWMDSFAANFIRQNTLERIEITPSVSPYYCPVCSTLLTRSNGDNIPDEVSVFDCPLHHGYFFPAGHLAAFKKAQSAKITYHKIWHIPLPNVTSVLLAGFILLILTGSMAATLTGLRHKQTTESHAQNILTGHAVYVSSDRTAILITAATDTSAAVTLHIPALNIRAIPMITHDGRGHHLTLPCPENGVYTYFFTTTVSETETQSEMFTFTIEP